MQPPQQILWLLLINKFLETLKFTKTFCVIEVTSTKTKQNSHVWIASDRSSGWKRRTCKENDFLYHLSKALIFYLLEDLLISDCSKLFLYKKQLSLFGKRVYFAWVIQILIQTTHFLRTIWAGLPCAVNARCPTQATSSYAQLNQELTVSPSKETCRCLLFSEMCNRKPNAPLHCFWNLFQFSKGVFIFWFFNTSIPHRHLIGALMYSAPPSQYCTQLRARCSGQ